METKEHSLDAKVCRLTSLAPAGVAVIEIAGTDAISLLHRFWTAATQRPLAIDHIRFGQWQSNDTSPGEDVVVCQTASNRVEVHCHGGKAAAEQILSQLVQAGARQVAGEDRAEVWPVFGTDRASRQAIDLLPQATTTATARILLDQARGSFTSAIRQLIDAIQHQRLTEANRRMQALIQIAPWGLHLIDPWNIAILGPPNVGKSSLLNRLLGYDRAIVHDQPGTTRDALQEHAAIEGWPVRFMDTAGIRDTQDPIELAGIARSKQAAMQADFRLVLLSPDVGWTDEHHRLLDHPTAPSTSENTLLVLTKSDLGVVDLANYSGPTRRIECQSQHGHQPVLDWLATRLTPPGWKPSAAVPFLQEHLHTLHACSLLMEQQAFAKGVERLQALID